jgi:hypothetical protein
MAAANAVPSLAFARKEENKKNKPNNPEKRDLVKILNITINFNDNVAKINMKN